MRECDKRRGDAKKQDPHSRPDKSQMSEEERESIKIQIRELDKTIAQARKAGDHKTEYAILILKLAILTGDKKSHEVLAKLSPSEVLETHKQEEPESVSKTPYSELSTGDAILWTKRTLDVLYRMSVKIDVAEVIDAVNEIAKSGGSGLGPMGMP